MSSPFPGMNPYLENHDVFHDFHERFCPLCAEFLTALVRPKYIVKLDEHVFIHELPAAQRHFLGRADIAVGERGSASEAASTAAMMSSPAYGRIQVAVDIERQSLVQILDRQTREVVTVIELLSPSNKYAGPDRDVYVAKRQQLLCSRVHLVEIDLLRGGPRLPVEGLASCAYYVMVSRAEERPRVGLWPLGLRDQLPTIPVPLKNDDPPARLDLQAIVHRLYDAAGYEDYIYDAMPQPALSVEDAAWAKKLMAGRQQTS